MITSDTIKRGLKKGLDTLYELSKVLIPVYIIIELLKISGLLAIISNFFSPVMSIFNLPGEASFVLIVGMLVNVYAAISAMLLISLTAKQATTLAIMISLAHNLLGESALIKKVGVSPIKSCILRITCSIICGFIYSNLF